MTMTTEYGGTLFSVILCVLCIIIAYKNIGFSTDWALDTKCKFDGRTCRNRMPGDKIAVKLERVKDGDTLQVKEILNPTVSYPVRLAYIDCPEMSQSYGQEAKRFLVEKLEAKHYHLELRIVSNSDLYKRKVAVVFLGSLNINLWLIQNGYAWRYAPMSTPKEYRDAEAEARAAKRGLWSLPNPKAPWEYRKEKRSGKGKQGGGGDGPKPAAARGRASAAKVKGKAGGRGGKATGRPAAKKATGRAAAKKATGRPAARKATGSTAAKKAKTQTKDPTRKTGNTGGCTSCSSTTKEKNTPKKDICLIQ